MALDWAQCIDFSVVWFESIDYGSWLGTMHWFQCYPIQFNWLWSLIKCNALISILYDFIKLTTVLDCGTVIHVIMSSHNGDIDAMHVEEVRT